MRSILILNMLILAADPSAAATHIPQRYPTSDEITLNQKPNMICPVDLTETQVELAQAGAPQTVELECKAGVQVKVEDGFAHDLRGGLLTLQRVSKDLESPQYRDQFGEIWIGRLQGRYLLLQPSASRGYKFQETNGTLTLTGVVGQDDLAELLAAGRRHTAKVNKTFALDRQDLPANVFTGADK